MNVDFNNTEVGFAHKSTSQLRLANFLFTIVNYPFITTLATGLLKLTLLTLNLPVKGIVRRTLFNHFCGGESIKETNLLTKKLFSHNVYTILDYSTESSKTDEMFDFVTDEIIRTIESAIIHKEIPFCVFKPTGIASFSLLAKIHAGEELSNDELQSLERIHARVEKICSFGHANNIPILIDAEHSWIQKPINDFTYAMMKKYNRKKCIVFNTYQMYLLHRLSDIQEAYKSAQREGYFLGVKIVRGAYMEIERERAENLGYSSPIWPDKASTDLMYNQALAYCIENCNGLSLISCTHNEESNTTFMSLLNTHRLSANDSRLWVSQLLGMSDNITFNMAKAGYNVAKYIPYGPIKTVLPYLLRRADENTSVRGQTPRELSIIKKELKRRKQK